MYAYFYFQLSGYCFCIVELIHSSGINCVHRYINKTHATMGKVAERRFKKK